MIIAFPFPLAAYDNLISTFLPPLRMANLGNFSHFHLRKHLTALICIPAMASGPEHPFSGLCGTHISLLKDPFVSFVK